MFLTGSVTVRGNVEIQHCTGASGYTGPGIQIGGNFECRDNTAPCMADGEVVGGNLQILNNSSQTASDVSLSTISGNLQCMQNEPAPADASGPNRIAGNAQGQCNAALGFSMQTLPATTAVIGPAGGTVTTPQGYQLVVPAGSLTAPTTVSLRQVERDEVAEALETSAFDGTKFNFIGAVQMATGGIGFTTPVNIFVPNSINLPSSAQVLVVQILRDVTGDNVADLEIVDTATVNGATIQDGATNPGATVGLRGVTGSGGRYAFFAANIAPYGFVSGSVLSASGAPLASAVVWNSQAPDFVALTDASGNFTAAMPPAAPAALFIGADNALAHFGMTIQNIPAKPIITPTGPRDPTISIAFQNACVFPVNLLSAIEPDLKNVEDSLSEALQQLISTTTVKVDIDRPSPIRVGQIATATVDIGDFVHDTHADSTSEILNSDITLHNPFNSKTPAPEVHSFDGVITSSPITALVCLDSTSSQVASVTPNGTLIQGGPNCESGAPPTYSVLGVAPGHPLRRAFRAC